MRGASRGGTKAEHVPNNWGSQWIKKSGSNQRPQRPPLYSIVVLDATQISQEIVKIFIYVSERVAPLYFSKFRTFFLGAQNSYSTRAICKCGLSVGGLGFINIMLPLQTQRAGTYSLAVSSQIRSSSCSELELGNRLLHKDVQNPVKMPIL